MDGVINLGKLVNNSPDEGHKPPQTYKAIHAAADSAPIDDKKVGEKAVEDTKEVPSIWFVNFPTKAAAGQQKLLAAYMQDVQDYRCWASLVWWRTVFSSDKIPQDGDKISIAKRSAYCAKVGVHHMKLTPWLGMNVDHNVSKQIECKASEFHTELLEAVLLGFVGVTAAALKALEGILQSLAKTVEQSSSNTDSKTIICERYEYIPEADVIRSYIRIVSFTVSDEMRNVASGKHTSKYVKCSIDYNEYEATFNQKLWDEEAADIDKEQKKAADDFRKKQTVDCPP